jgi:hypothetical protein
MQSFGCGFAVLLLVMASMQAQQSPRLSPPAAAASAVSTDEASAPASPAAAVGQAPDDVIHKIGDLVNAGKYADAQRLTTGLLAAYPNDQRLINTKALLDKLVTPAAPAAGSTAPAPPTANTEQLSGMDKVDYNALIELARQAQASTDLDQQNALLRQFMDQSKVFLQQHPDQMLLWQLRAASAISLQEPMDGYEAGRKLIAAGGTDSNDASLQQLLAKLKLLGWLDKQGATAAQASADNDRAQQSAAAEQEQEKVESAKYTFPVFHVNGIRYEYGHLTINKDGAIYVGTDGTDRLAKSDMRELKVACNAYACGFYFTPNSGRRFFFLAVLESAVANRSDKGKIYLPPSVIGNAIVARWEWVATDKKTLSPPAGTSAGLRQR